jgi:hypothetical protein
MHLKLFYADRPLFLFERSDQLIFTIFQSSTVMLASGLSLKLATIVKLFQKLHRQKSSSRAMSGTVFGYSQVIQWTGVFARIVCLSFCLYSL